MRTRKKVTTIQLDSKLLPGLREKAQFYGVPMKVLTNALVAGLVTGKIRVEIEIEASTCQPIVLHPEAIAS